MRDEGEVALAFTVKGIDGFFSEREGRWYARFARGLVGGTFVEVGSWKGRSTSFIGRICNDNGTRLVCVDHWAGSRDALAERDERALAEGDIEAEFRANMSALGIDVEVMRMSSVEAAGRFPLQGVDRVFLDASHDSESVAADLAAWFDRIAPGGILAGHDYDTQHPTVSAAVDAFAAARSLTIERGPRSIFWLVRTARTA